MSNLLDLLSLVVNVISIFASVSFAASAATGAANDLLQSRARYLLGGIKDLLFDPSFTGLARALYNTETINPLGNGNIQSEAELKLDTTKIDPDRFAAAMLQILHIDQYANAVNDGTRYEVIDKTLPPQVLSTLQIKNATMVIEQLVDPSSQPHLIIFVTNLVTRDSSNTDNNLNIDNMKKAIIEWYDTGIASVIERFTRRIRLYNFLVAFLIAAVLDLKPIPLGGFATLLALRPGTPGETALAGSIPYAIAAFQWLLVALSSLPGAEFWFNLLKRFSSK